MSQDDAIEIEPIAHIRTPFPEKFGIPRQSGLVGEAAGTIIFEKPYRDPAALRGIETFSHLWLIWGFSEVEEREFRALVRPPRLGGNEKRGVFATRSPYRPNELGLSVVRLDGVEKTRDEGSVIHVSGVDLLDMTPIYDIKPYLPYADRIDDACDGFAADGDAGMLLVVCDEGQRAAMGHHEPAILAALARDPRPAYHDDPHRVYEMRYADLEIGFTVDDITLKVVNVQGMA